MLRENKKQEILQKIVNESAADKDREYNRERALKAIRDGKRFSYMTKQLEVLAEQRRLAEEAEKKRAQSNKKWGRRVSTFNN